jgi:replicative DNA helicase
VATAPPIDGRSLGRVPPHDLEAEQSVLGAILLDEIAIVKVSEFLRPDDFYRKNHADVYRASLELLAQGEPIDIVTVGSELEKMGVLERIGGRSYLAQLEQSVPTAANIEYYGRIVKEKATKRSLISAGGDIAGLGYDDAVEASDALNSAQKIVFDLSEDRVSADFEKLFQLLRRTMERVDTLQAAGGGGVIGVPSGFYDLDGKTNGFKTGELIIVAGRPAMGKTSLALNVALEAAVMHQVPIAIFSLEMSKDQLAERLLCEYARVDAQRLHKGLLGEAEVDRLARSLGPLGEAPIYIDDSPLLDELMLLTKSRRAKLQHGIGMVVVDYLQLMHSRGGGDDNRVQEVSQISRSMKALARELEVPVIAISQLSRAPEQRTDKRPMLSDLRESGSIEQDADVVLFLYREGYYNRADTSGIAEVIVAKNRNGPVGTVNLRFVPELTRFENVDMRRRAPDEE